MISRGAGVVGLLLGLCMSLSGCTVVYLGALDEEGGYVSSADYSASVVVVFETSDDIGVDIMDQLLGTELEADGALARAGVGLIEGNEVGAGTYELYFVGTDPERVWDLIEPIFASAPVAWDRVELRDSPGDPTPVVLRL